MCFLRKWNQVKGSDWHKKPWDENRSLDRKNVIMYVTGWNTGDFQMK
jgi:hypothetical protein